MAQATLEGVYSHRGEGVLAKQVADEMVLVDVQHGVYHGLNAVGVQIWEQFDGKRSLGEIAAGIAAAFPEVERSTIEADAVALTQALLDNDLVVPR